MWGVLISYKCDLELKKMTFGLTVLEAANWLM